MTMPSKNRHNITVDNTKYHYMVSKTMMVTIQNTETQRLITVRVLKKSRVGSVKPSHVKAMIVSAGAENWIDSMEQKYCECGNIGSPDKTICVFDNEIRRDGVTPRFCHCCESCRKNCADDI